MRTTRPPCRSLSIMTSHSKKSCRSVSRRAILKDIALAPLVLRAAPLFGLWPQGGISGDELAFTDVRLTPHYPLRSPLADVLRLVTPGSDDYVTEKYAVEIESILSGWGREMKASPGVTPG